MTETAFTPGPWETSGAENRAFRTFNWYQAAIRTRDGVHVADLPQLGDEGTNATLDANARLIAAAPDLLAACLDVLGNLREHDDVYLFAGSRIKKRLEDAVIRAGGEVQS